MRRASTWLASLALGGGLVAGCQNAGSDLGFAAAATGTVLIQVYLDRDGSRTPSLPTDTVFAHARIALLALAGSDTLRSAQTAANGIASFEGVPVGEYRVAVDPLSIGDSIVVSAIDSAHVIIRASGEDQGVLVRLGYPELSIRQARALPLGRRAFIRGVVLVGVQQFRDTTSHVADTSGQIRLTRVQLRAGLTGNNPGDSVSVLGVASTRAGQPTLDLALVSKFGSRPAPIALPLSSANAATASGGVLDAALVQVIGVTILDTATVAPDYQLTVSDGSGPVRIIFDANLGFPRSPFTPGKSLNVKGVLVPDGFGAWKLKPREFADVVIN